MQFDRDKSLQQLDGQDWGEATFDSRLVTECHRLRRVPLRKFAVEDLRVMIGQRIGIEYLVPIALERLRADPLTEGSYYPGDLLAVVLRTDHQFWRCHPALKDEIAKIALTVSSSFADNAVMREAYDQFQKDQTPAV